MATKIAVDSVLKNKKYQEVRSLCDIRNCGRIGKESLEMKVISYPFLVS